MKKDTATRVKHIVATSLGVDQNKIKHSDHFTKDLGADSLDVLDLTMAFEEEFLIDIPDGDADKIETVGDAINYIDEKVKND